MLEIPWWSEGHEREIMRLALELQAIIKLFKQQNGSIPTSMHEIWAWNYATEYLEDYLPIKPFEILTEEEIVHGSYFADSLLCTGILTQEQIEAMTEATATAPSITSPTAKQPPVEV